MTMITPSYLGETIEYSSLHACRSTLEDPTHPDFLWRHANCWPSGEWWAAHGGAAGWDDAGDTEREHEQERDVPVCDERGSAVRFDAEHVQQHGRNGALDSADRTSKRE